MDVLKRSDGKIEVLSPYSVQYTFVDVQGKYTTHQLCIDRASGTVAGRSVRHVLFLLLLISRNIFCERLLSHSQDKYKLHNYILSGTEQIPSNSEVAVHKSF